MLTLHRIVAKILCMETKSRQSRSYNECNIYDPLTNFENDFPTLTW